MWGTSYTVRNFLKIETRVHENGDPGSPFSHDTWLSMLHAEIILSYLREKGPMGGAPYIGSRLGDGPIFEVSLSQLDAKERPGKLSTRSS